MPIKRTLLGFAFEGVGLDTDLSSGLCVCFGRHTPHPSTDYEWVDALARLPDSVSTDVNPFTGDWSTSAHALEILASDRLAELLMSDERRTSLALAISMNDSTGVISIGDTTLAGSVVWVDDEAILLVSHSGSGVYVCTRGFWGSAAAAHDAGAGVYTRIPYWEKRLVRLVEHDVDTGDEVVRWRGLVSEISQERGLVLVSCEEYLAALTRAEVNRSPRDLASGAGLVWEVTPTVSRLRGVLPAPYQSSVAQGPGTATLYVEADGFVASVGQSALEGSGRVEITQWLFERRPEAADGDAFSGSLWEVLLFLDVHPLEAALTLLTSSGQGTNGAYDTLGEAWGLALDIVDVAGWTAEIAISPHLRIDHLTLGAGGARVNVLRDVQDLLLRPFGYFLSITVTGELGIARLRLPTIADASGATPVKVSAYPDGPLRLDRGLGQQAQEVVARVGGTPGTGDGRDVTIRQLTARTRRTQLGDVRTLSYDLQAISPRRLSSARRGGSALVSALASLLSLGIDTVPRLKIRIADHNVTGSPPPDLGSWIAVADLGPLEDAWIVNASGQRVSATDTADLIGMAIGRRWDLAAHTYEVTLLLMAFRVGVYVRERAPAAVVTSWNAGTLTATVESATFGGAPTDPETFTVGDEVTLYERDGRIASSEVRTVTAVTATTITLSGGFTSAPSAGRVIGLPYSNEYANAARYPATPRPYTAITNPDEGVIEELDGSTSPPDIYGSSVYGGV